MPLPLPALGRRPCRLHSARSGRNCHRGSTAAAVTSAAHFGRCKRGQHSNGRHQAVAAPAPCRPPQAPPAQQRPWRTALTAATAKAGAAVTSVMQGRTGHPAYAAPVVGLGAGADAHGCRRSSSASAAKASRSSRPRGT
mmetsp:Transcript_16310/g.49276  ORF Transcript_16310/g.49276 Transcript_16310/m.49276 type:complete len:139 (+) Transcript_16310:177-593(+)